MIALLAALALVLPPATPAGQVVFYGHIKSLAPSGNRYVLRLDPALPLVGVTAAEAAAEDLPPGVGLVDGFYARDESHALLTFIVPRTARITIVTKGRGSAVASTRVQVAELTQLLRGRNPNQRRLLATPAAYGFWVRVDGDQVRSLDAQYRP